MNDITPRIHKLESYLKQTCGMDRFVLGREIHRFRQGNKNITHPKLLEKSLSELEKRLHQSRKKRMWRRENLPKPKDIPALPITAKKEEIIRAIKHNQIVIISGETGSGKTTQIPKFCLAAGYGIDGKIGCTQPRRIAATTVAHRVAHELGEELGQSVGYKIRFKDRCPDRAFIKFMTDGILLAEMQGDRFLNAYNTIIVDEAHERTTNIDFILGLLKKLLRKRKSLNLVITSATIDTEKFSKAFGNAPIIEVSGRMYPVEVRYPDDKVAAKGKEELTHVEQAVHVVAQLSKKKYGGDILVFMPSEQDIRDTCGLLENRRDLTTSILPLFARLSAREQKKVFSNSPGRKIIVATNVAETSITIPGIKYVVDTGLARIAQYSPRSRTTGLPVLPISRSSADQRKGRCGRMENGICIRLYSEADYLDRPLFTPPEILRTNLAETILRMKYLNIGDVSNFPFIDRPTVKSIQDGHALLRELGAIKLRSRRNHPGRHTTDPKRSGENSPFLLTQRGRLMAKIPLDPRLSRMLIQAKSEGCLREITIIASALSIRDPRSRLLEKRDQADQVHAAFNHPDSDFISILNIWDRWEETLRLKKNHRKMKRFCKDHFLSYPRMREWQDIHRQIYIILKESGFTGSGLPGNTQSVIKSASFPREEKITAGGSPAARNYKQAAHPASLSQKRYAAIHRSILSGFLSNIALKREKNIFTAAKGKEVMIFPGSGLFNAAGEWIVSAEMVETSRLFARVVANVDPGWLEELGKDQCRYTYLNPHWVRNRGDVVAHEQVTLFGLIIVAERTICYGRINPDEASDIFIRSALVEGDLKKPFGFMTHNLTHIEEVKTIENKVRRKDLFVDDEMIFTFYKERLAGVYNLQLLRQLIKKQGNDEFLKMQKEDLMQYIPDETELTLFPNHIEIENNEFECSYNFNPGKTDDGVTVSIPAAVALTVPLESIDWIVPGMCREKITFLIKGLAKSYRKKLMPVAKTVDLIIQEMPRAKGTLLSELGKLIYHRFGVDIPASAWPADQLPNHLKMRISIIGRTGKELESSRNPAILRRPVNGKKNQSEFEDAIRKWEKLNLIRWDFGDLTEAVVIQGKNRTKGTFFPGLASSKATTGCDLRLFRTRSEAVMSHIDGVKTLTAIHLSKELKFLIRAFHLPRDKRAASLAFGGHKMVEENLYETITTRVFAKNIRKEADFSAHLETARHMMFSTGRKLLEKSLAILEAYDETVSVLKQLTRKQVGTHTLFNFLEILNQELTQLVPKNFMVLYKPDRLIHLPRYIKGVAIRARRGMVDFEKDRQKDKKVTFYTDILKQRLKTLSPVTSQEKRQDLEAFFWMIEDYKISLFAQELKTVGQVSEKRLNKKLADIDRMV